MLLDAELTQIGGWVLQVVLVKQVVEVLCGNRNQRAFTLRQVCAAEATTLVRC